MKRATVGLAILFVSILTQAAAADSLRIAFTNFVGRGPLLNFPALVKLTPDNTADYTGFLRPADGYDLRFWSDADVPLNYEIEAWNPNGTSLVWVQVPLLTHDAAIWASWGDASATDQPACTTNGAVWSEGFAAVWHLNETNGTHRDATGNGFTGTPYNGVNQDTNGLIDGADGFDGVNDHIRTATTANSPLSGTNAFALSAWIKTSGAGLRVIMQQRAPGIEGECYFSVLNDGKLDYWDYNGGYGLQITSAQSVSDDNWRHVAFVRDGDTGRLFIDGAQAGTDSATPVSMNPALYFAIGTDLADSTASFRGGLDEVRVALTSHSADWVWASWMNQGASHDAFVEYGPVRPIANRAQTAVQDTQATLNGTLYAAGTNYYATVYWGQTDGGTNATAWAHARAVGLYTDTNTAVSHTATTGIVGTGTNFFTWRATNANISIWAGRSPSWTREREWSGASANDAWGTGPNWVGENVPELADEDVRFAGQGTGPVDLNGSGYTVGAVTFAAGGYSLVDTNAAPGALTASTLVNAAGANAIGVGLNVSGPVEVAGGALTLRKPERTSAGQLKLSGGALTVEATAVGTTPGSYVWDFESGTLAGWRDVGTSHGSDTVFKNNNNPISHNRTAKQGTYKIDTYAPNQGHSDAWTGILESDSFTLGAGCQFSMHMTGGSSMWSGDPDNPPAGKFGVALERRIAPGDWENLFWSSGTVSETPVLRTWDASAYAGQTVRLRIYDTGVGGWEQITADDIQATAIIGLDRAPIAMTNTPVLVASSASINAIGGTNTAALGVLTVSNNATLTTAAGNPLGFRTTTFPATATAVGFNANVDTYLTQESGLDGSGAAVAITKTGPGNLILNKAGGNLGSATFNMQAGALVALHAGAFGAAALSLNGGELKLSSPGGDITYAKNVSVAQSSTLTAGMAGGGVAGPLTNTLSGDIAFTGTQTLTARATSDYTLRLGGQLVGSGTLNVAAGSVIVDDPSFNAVTLSGGALTVYSNLTVNALTHSGGTFTMAGTSRDLTVSNTLTLAGTLDLSGGPTLALAGATVTLNSGANLVYDETLIAGTLTLNSGATLSLGTNALAAGIVNLPDGGNLNTTGPIVTSGELHIWPERTVANRLLGDGDVHIGDPENNVGVVALAATNAYTGSTLLRRAVLRTDDGMGLPAGSLLMLRASNADFPCVLETRGTFTRPIGLTPGAVYWDGAGVGGGFSARGGNLDLTLEGNAALSWSSAGLGFNNRDVLQLNYQTSDAKVELTNPINLNAATRYIQVGNNPAVKTDFARLSGTITGSGVWNSAWLRFNLYNAYNYYNGLVELTGTNTFTQGVVPDYAAVYAVDGVGLPATSLLYFEANDVWEEGLLLSQGTFSRQIGLDAPGQVYWGTHGGFAARGGPLTVSLEGGAPLDWGSATTGFNNQWLQLGSMYADNLVDLTNAISLGANRPVIVFENLDTDQDVAKLSGVISGAFELRKHGNDTHRAGTLWLSGTNTFSGGIILDQGALRAVDGVGLPAASRLYFEGDIADIPCVLESSGTFTRNIENTGGSVHWGTHGGFAAWGGKFDVNLEDGSELQFDSATNGFNNMWLHLGSRSADNVVELKNAINLNEGGTWRTISLFDNPHRTTDYAVISGNIRNGLLWTLGDGLLKLAGANTFRQLLVANTSTVRINGRQTGMEWVYTWADQAATVGGTGTINSIDMEIRALGTLAPGDGAGTLTTAISSAQGLRMLNNSIYEWELGPEAADTVKQTGNLTLDAGWTLKLRSAGGTPRANRPYDLFTYTGTFAGSVTPASIDTSGLPNDWVTSGAQVLHDTTSTPRRIYLTGLYSDLSVANGTPTGLTATSATLNGTVSAQTDPLYVSVYWSTNDGGTNAGVWLAAGAMAGIGSTSSVTGQPLSHAIGGLTTNRLYYYTFRATNATGSLDLWATPAVAFRTLGPPAVDNGTGALLPPGMASAILRGALTAGVRADVRVYWGRTDGAATTNWQHVVTLADTPQGAFETTVGVAFGAQYYYRCFASNEAGTAWAPASTSFVTRAWGLGHIPGCSLWLSAAELALTNGASVDVWPDSSGHERHAIGVNGYRPTFKATGANGRPTVGFAQSLQRIDPRYLDVTFAGGHTPGDGPTVFAVVTVPAGVGDGVRVGAIWGSYPAGPNYDLELHGNGHMRWWWNGGEVDAYGTANTRTGQPLLLTFIRDRDQNRLQTYTNGVLDLDHASAGVNAVYGANWRVGADLRGLPGIAFIGDIAELVVYDRTLTSNEANTAGFYLEAKYGLDTAYAPPKLPAGMLILVR